MSSSAHDVFERPLPQSHEAERCVLGSVLINNSAWYRVTSIVKGDDFFMLAHRTIWAGICNLMNVDRAVDLVTLCRQIERDNDMDEVGGHHVVSALIDGIPDVANVERYATLVARDAKLRRLAILASKIAGAAVDAEEEPEVIASRAIAALSELSSKQDARPLPMWQVLGDCYAEAEDRLNRKVGYSFQTGLGLLDSYQAFYPTLIALGAPSKNGKTAFTIDVGARLARNGHPVFLASLESLPRQLGWRYASSRTGIPHGRIKDWRFAHAGDVEKLIEVGRDAHDLPFVLSRSFRTVQDIHAECLRLKTFSKLDVLMIDYIQLVRAPGIKFGTDEERLRYVCQELSDMAVDLNIAVVVTSQLRDDWKNNVGSNPDQPISPTDMKGARAIGEVCRVVLAFHRPHVQTPEVRPCLVKFQVAANNEERTGFFDLHFDEVTQRFSEGDCYSNDCRELRRGQPQTHPTFFNGGGN